VILEISTRRGQPPSCNDGDVQTVIMAMPLGLIALNLYALALVVLRGPLFKTRIYKPMILNIGLSLAPAGIALAALILILVSATIAPSTFMVLTLLIVMGLLWLAALPNAAYLITELNLTHRRADDDVPLWYDIVLVLTLAMSGVLNTLANVALAQLVITAVTSRDVNTVSIHAPGPWIFTGVVLLLVSFGIYLGRYIRFNSWDLMHPGGFVRKLVAHFRAPGNLRAAVGLTLTHTVFLAILYVIVALPLLATILA
jgi:uncharacterized membrane protein